MPDSTSIRLYFWLTIARAGIGVMYVLQSPVPTGTVWCVLHGPTGWCRSMANGEWRTEESASSNRWPAGNNPRKEPRHLDRVPVASRA